MQIKMVSIGSVKPYPRNPRINDAAVSSVTDSLRTFGFRKPIVVDKKMVIICGHTCFKAAQALGLKKIPVHIAADLTPGQVRAYRLADNKLAELSQWDAELLPLELQDVMADGMDLMSLGFTQDDIDLYLPPPETEGQTDPDAVPETPKKPVSKLGKVYQLGPHKLMCGDCRISKNVTALMNKLRINLAFTSPPYAEQRQYDKKSGFTPIPPDKYVKWFADVSANIHSRLADDGSFFINIKPSAAELDTELYVFDLVIAHVREWGWHFATEFCWERNGIPQQVIRRFKNQYEPIYQFTKGDWKMCPESVQHKSESVPLAFGKGKAGDTNAAKRQGIKSAVDGNKVLKGMAYPGNRLPTFAGSHEALGHSAAFPVGLPEFFIKAYTDEADTVFEPFAGSGSVLIACEKTNRKSFNIEISPAYCDVIRRRWAEFVHGKDCDWRSLTPEAK